MSVNAPLISVVMPVYNREKYLVLAIDSILQQTFPDFEFLIIDDGSTDASASIVKSYQDERIRFIPNAKNEGIVYTMNKGIQEARGQFIARMDSDDIALPQRLETEVQALRDHPEAAFVSSQITQIDAQGTDKGPWAPERAASTYEQIRGFIRAENYIANPTVLFRSEILKKYRYKKNQELSEDWDLWLRMFSAGERMFKINEVLLKYRIHEQSVTTRYNLNGIYLKKSRIQLTYVFNTLSRLRFNAFDFGILKNGVLNFAKHLLNRLHPSMLAALKQVKATDLRRLWLQYKTLKRQLNTFPENKKQLYFFFPFYHVGGAERVHADILEAVPDQKPVVFITNVSAGAGFKERFSENALLLDLSLLSGFPFVRSRVMKLLSGHIGNNANATVFGCNSLFYYHLLPALPPSVTCIDLVHAFVHPDEPGPEYWSLQVAERLKARVVITKKTKEDFERLYRANNLNPGLIDRVVYIPNFTEIPSAVEKTRTGSLRVMYVGRGSAEKRVHLVGQIARKVKTAMPQTEMTLVGDLVQAVHPEDRVYCNFTGEIKETRALQELYKKTDVLILTSSREGFPMVIMEAMAFGVVVVSTDVGGIADHVQSGKNGILIHKQDEAEIVTGFVEALTGLNQDRAQLNRLSANAAEYARTHFNKEQFTQAYRKLLGAES